MKTRTLCSVSHPLVAVYWLDAYTESGWITSVEPSDDLVVTYGLLIKKTKNWVVLAQTHIPGSKDEKGYWGSTWNIPTSMVRDIQVIQKNPICKAK